MGPENGYLLLRGEVAALPAHACSSARVLPLTPAKANSRSDWGNTGEHSCLPLSEPKAALSVTGWRSGALHFLIGTALHFLVGKYSSLAPGPRTQAGLPPGPPQPGPRPVRAGAAPGGGGGLPQGARPQAGLRPRPPRPGQRPGEAGAAPGGGGRLPPGPRPQGGLPPGPRQPG